MEDRKVAALFGIGASACQSGPQPSIMKIQLSRPVAGFWCLGRLPMSSRTTMSVVTFLPPFVVARYMDELPAGDCGVLADDDVMLSHSSAVYRQTATFLLINWPAGKSELRAVLHRDLELAWARD